MKCAFGNNLIEAKRSNPVFSEEDDILSIPRIDMATQISHFIPVNWIRRQISIKEAFALTFNNTRHGHSPQ